MYFRISCAHKKFICTAAVRTANPLSVAVTVTRPWNPAGLVSVVFMASPGPVTAGARVTPAAVAAASTVQSIVRPPGSALILTTLDKVPAGTRPGAARRLRSRTGTRRTLPSTRRLGKSESAARKRKVPARTPACNVAVAGNTAGLPPAMTVSPVSTVQLAVRAGATTDEVTDRLAVAAPSAARSVAPAAAGVALILLNTIRGGPTYGSKPIGVSLASRETSLGVNLNLPGPSSTRLFI